MLGDVGDNVSAGLEGDGGSYIATWDVEDVSDGM